MPIYHLNGRNILLPKYLNLAEDKAALVQGSPNMLNEVIMPAALVDYVLDSRKNIGNMARLELHIINALVKNKRKGLTSIVTAPIIADGIPTRVVGNKEEPVLCFETIRDSLYRLAKLGFLKRVPAHTYDGKYIYVTADDLPSVAELIPNDVEPAIIAKPTVAKEASNTLVSTKLYNAASTLMDLAAMYADVEEGKIQSTWLPYVMEDFKPKLWSVSADLNELIQRDELKK